jgi:hypothetical protein
MRPIGFSTGALALSNFRLALEELQGQPVNAVELSALRYPELQPLLDALETLTLAPYNYKSIHAPSSFSAGQEADIIDRLKLSVPKDWPIVLHPDTIHDFSAWRVLGNQLAIENMDRRKPIGRTLEELNIIFEELPEAMFCFDIGHARQCDTTMTEAYRILREYSKRLCQVHVSEVNTASRHDPLSLGAILAFSQVADLIPPWVPLILESRVTRAQIMAEIDNVQKALPIAAVWAVPA